MADYSEDRLQDALSLYRGNFEDAVSIPDFHQFTEETLRDGSDYGPLAGIASDAKLAASSARRTFGYHLIADKAILEPSLDFAQRVSFLGFSVEYREFSKNDEYITPDLSIYGEYLLECIAVGRDGFVKPAERIALAVLTSGRYAPGGTDTDYFTVPSKIGVFALEMLAAVRGETIDWESFHVPPDRFWLECARTGLTEADPGKAADWARQLCDAHMATLQTDQENFLTDVSAGFEIANEAHFLWPITVHAFLRLRTRLGLETGEIDHPLMRTSFAILRDWDVTSGAWIAPAWFEEIVDGIVAVEPSLADMRDLVL